MGTAIQDVNSRLGPYQFKKGQSGNPLGRSVRKYSVVNEVKNALAGVYGEKYDAKAIALRLMKIVINARTSPGIVIAALSLIWQYTEQKPVQKVEVVTEPDAAELCHRAYKALYDGAIAQGLVIDEFTNNLILDGVEKIYGNAREVAPDLFANVGGESSTI